MLVLVMRAGGGRCRLPRPVCRTANPKHPPRPPYLLRGAAQRQPCPPVASQTQVMNRRCFWCRLLPVPSPVRPQQPQQPPPSPVRLPQPAPTRHPHHQQPQLEGDGASSLLLDLHTKVTTEPPTLVEMTMRRPTASQACTSRQSRIVNMCHDVWFACGCVRWTVCCLWPPPVVGRGRRPGLLPPTPRSVLRQSTHTRRLI